MSILIKNMEMPKNCETCELSSTDSSGFFGCCVTGNIVMRKREQDKPSWCPLIEIKSDDVISKGALFKVLAEIDGNFSKLKEDNNGQISLHHKDRGS